jgi:Ca2+-binding RTX toxin-like protein
VTLTLPPNVENLLLTGTAARNGTGNSINNILTGNSAANTLSGGTGADTMIGGMGNDTYVVDSALDVVIENLNEGVDLVKSGVTYTLASNVENLTLTGSSTINGTGNALNNALTGNSAANTLAGGAGNDTLNGGSGSDTMMGGAGDDIYFVNVASDKSIELVGEGNDTVNSSVTYTLAANVENLTLTGTTAINGTGNTLDNVLKGNSAVNSLSGAAGNDTLEGMGGADSLTGGTGNDTYILGRGYGADTAVENDATAGNTDIARFLSGISSEQIWFQHVGNNLEASVIGTADKLVVKDWYLDAAYHVEQFKTTDGAHTLLDSNVQNLVNAMASFAPPAAGQTTLPTSYQDALAGVIAANWQ